MSQLEVRDDRGVRHLILNRPEKRNALSFALCREIVLAVEEAWHDETAGAILLSANGPAFCAGMDLSEMFTPEAETLSHIHEQLFTIGARITKPVVAAVHGAALAGGVGLVANAHIVVAADDANFALTEIRIGLWPFLIFRAVSHAIGERRAVELSLTGRSIGAAEAAQLGLVHYVVPAAEVVERAMGLAASLAAASPVAVASGLEFVLETRGMAPAAAGQAAHRFRQEVFRSEDFAEGIRAFKEKRPPRWRPATKPSPDS